jgi:flagellin
MSVINTNLSAVIAQNALRASEGQLSKSMERLSTGLRINSAKDDAAGLAISTRMTSAIRGLGVSLKNASDGISLAQTAEGAMGEMSNILQRIRELAVQSASGSYSNIDRSFLDSEASGLIAEVARIASQSSFNQTKLLNGSFIAQNFQLGFASNDSMTFNGIENLQSTALGQHQLDTTGGTAMNLYLASASSAVSSTIGQETNLKVTTASGGTSSTITWAAASGADTIANAINAGTANIGVTAKATNTATLGTISEAGNVSFTLNDQSIVANINTTSDLTSLAAAINGTSNSSKVIATFADPNLKSSLNLTASDGRNIQITGFSVSGGGNATARFGTQTLTEGSTNSSNKTGIVTLISAKGSISLSGAGTTEFASPTATSTFSSIQGISIATQNGSVDSLNVIDAAQNQINNNRANLGALINRLEASISSQSNSIMNLSSSRSRILDSDYAKETSLLAKSMIIQQAATAMLGQANQNPRLVLHLLK